ncbi:phage tail terminator protein [Pseudomonas quasicaspiana]|uniref:phage tail terminator protein n=1 Tax=Pseudomonas quasicaspiana TaxID=2829821 RepID=UPI001E2C5A98|nr:hypothetical protein [Pseudomonas quasicaspiana]MCD5980511.1 hypothetical protein [Pseudomonas quasicaspiana]
MRLTPTIRQMRAHCPSFGRRIFGGLDWDPTKDVSKALLPAAYVVVLGDDADPSDAQNAIRQVVRDTFDVCVEVDNADERGQAAADVLHDLRAELWRALVGFEPGDDGDPLQYDSSDLMLINRSKAVYRFRFYTEFQLGRNDPLPGQATAPAETWQEQVLDGIAPLEGIDMDVDFIDPMVDHNLSETGPDGRIEIKTREDLQP